MKPLSKGKAVIMSYWSLSKPQEYVLAPPSQHPHHCITVHLFLPFFPIFQLDASSCPLFSATTLVSCLVSSVFWHYCTSSPTPHHLSGRGSKLGGKAISNDPVLRSGEEGRYSSDIPNLVPSYQGEAGVFLHYAYSKCLKHCGNGYRACIEAAPGEALA